MINMIKNDKKNYPDYYPDLKMNKKFWISWSYIMHFNDIGPQHKLQV